MLEIKFKLRYTNFNDFHINCVHTKLFQKHIALKIYLNLLVCTFTIHYKEPLSYFVSMCSTTFLGNERLT